MSSIVAQLDAGLSYAAKLVDRPEIDYESLVVYSSWAVTAFELYILMYDLKTPPAELKEDLSPELFVKAQKYGKDKTRYSVLKTLVDQLISVYMIRSGVYHRAWSGAAELLDAFGFTQDYTIVKSLVWMTILVGISLATSIPFSWYYTFVIEERHGFNKQTTKLWIMDQIKTYILMAVIGLPFLAGFLKVVEKAGRGFVPWLMLFVYVHPILLNKRIQCCGIDGGGAKWDWSELFLRWRTSQIFPERSLLTASVAFQLLMQIIYPTFIQPLFNKLTPLPAGDLRARTEKLASQLGFPLKHLYQIDGSKRSSHSNAYFYGLPWSKHIVVYDTLMEKSTPSEVEAVLGHELGHWYFSHPSKLLLVAQSHLFFTLTVFSIFIHNASLYSSFGFPPALATHNPAGGAQPIIIGFMLFQFVLTPLDTVVKFGMNSITRAYEYQADEFAVELDKREELKNALIKLHRDNLSSPHNDSWYSAYNHSHPTLPERIRAIDAYRPRKNLKLQTVEKKDL